MKTLNKDKPDYKDLDELRGMLSSMTDKELEKLKEWQEYVLLCYPQGHECLEVEQLVQDLDVLWYPEYYTEGD
jgi:hypothetical protein